VLYPSRSSPPRASRCGVPAGCGGGQRSYGGSGWRCDVCRQVLPSTTLIFPRLVFRLSPTSPGTGSWSLSICRGASSEQGCQNWPDCAPQRLTAPGEAEASLTNSHACRPTGRVTTHCDIGRACGCGHGVVFRRGRGIGAVSGRDPGECRPLFRLMVDRSWSPATMTAADERDTGRQTVRL